MSVNITVSSSGNVTITDNQSGSVSQIIPAQTSFVGSVSEYYPNLSIGTGTTNVALPINVIQFVYLKNLSQTATLTVSWTPNGGVSAVVITLRPGSFICFCENDAVAGITALSLTASSGSTPVQMVLAG